MGKNTSFVFFMFFGMLMTVTGFTKIINLEVIPFESLSYNIGHYCGTYARAFVGVIFVFKGLHIIK